MTHYTIYRASQKEQAHLKITYLMIYWDKLRIPPIIVYCVAHSMLFYIVINTLAFVPYLSREQITNAEAAQARALISGWVGIEVLSHWSTTGGKIGKITLY